MNNVTIEQIKIGLDNFCYIIYSKNCLKAAVVDPGYHHTKILNFIKINKLELKYIINTHYHFDHTGGNKKIKNSTSAKIVASKKDGKRINSNIDLAVEDGDQLQIGEITLKFLSTPGHTPGGMCIIIDNEALITGDTLFIGDCGRTDLNGGNLNDMFISLSNKIMNLPDNLIVYPGHDYGNKPFEKLGDLKVSIKKLINEIEKSL